MYHYEPEPNVKLNSRSLYTRDKNHTVAVVKDGRKGLEVSLSTVNSDFPQFDFKLRGGALWSKHAIRPEEFDLIYDMLTEIRDTFPNTPPNFGQWERRVRD